jgi:prolyl oligopeptidase
MIKCGVAAAALALIGSPAAAAERLGPPPAPRRPVTDDYFGVKVEDPFRWLENMSDPAQKAWFESQDAYARTTLERMPGHGALSARVSALSAATERVSQVSIAGGRLFYLKRGLTSKSAVLTMRDEGSSQETVLWDPLAQGDGQSYSIDQFAPEESGRRLAMVISRSGAEDGDIVVMDVGSKTLTADRIVRAPFAEISWGAGGAGFYYRHLAPASSSNAAARYDDAVVKWHQLGGDPGADEVVFGRVRNPELKLNSNDIPAVAIFPREKVAIASTGTGSDFALRLFVSPYDPAAPANFRWTELASYDDGIVEFAPIAGGIYFLSRKDASRLKVLWTNGPAQSLAEAKTVVPMSDRVLVRIVAAQDGLYVVDFRDGAAGLRRVRHAGHAIDEVELPYPGSIRGVACAPDRPGSIAALQSWVSPQEWYQLTPSRVAKLSLVANRFKDTGLYVIETLKAAGRDAVEIPLTVVRRRDVALDGRAPVLMRCYGQFGIFEPPSYLGGFMALLEGGGIFAYAHVRGGGEKGVAWHEAGRLAKKPNSHKDLIACAEHLIAKGYCSPKTLVIQGESGGGVAVGMALVTRPDLFAGSIHLRTDSNALRLEAAPDGGLPDELGSVKTPEGVRMLRAVDPTQHVQPGVAYPPALLWAAYNDARVPPWQPGKLAAHLQSAKGGPALLRVDFDAGHVPGQGLQSRADREVADQLAFILWCAQRN